MSTEDPNDSSENPAHASVPAEEPALATRNQPPAAAQSGRKFRVAGFVFLLLLILAIAAFFLERHHIGTQMRANLPQIDGSLTVHGLAASVTVRRDAHGVPHIHAQSMNDLIFAQGYITAQDRLWQMELLRRHAAGELSEILGRSALEIDRYQRALQLRAAADRAVAALPADQKHWLETYARGVNASIAAQQDHLPIEFRVLGFQPAAWTSRDSILVELGMFEELTNGFPEKLGHEALAAQLPPDLLADMYPIGSWRDHPPGQPMPDVTAPQPEIHDVPLDESQTRLRRPATPAADLLALKQTLRLIQGPCDTCVAGSNGWAVSGARTASGKPMLSNDEHLALSVPTVWYEADLQAENPAPLAAFHAAGVTLPGLPFVVAGHNQHIAWGFTNLGADIQDLFIEHTRGTPSGAEYETSSGAWRPVRYQPEVIRIRGSGDVTLNVPMTHHGDMDTPLISSLFPNERRSLSLQWTIYDPANVTVPFFDVNFASDWTSLLSAFSNWGGPPLSMMYADDQGHIGYHAVGRIPIRGDVNNPGPLSPVPVDVTVPNGSSHEWAGYIPFDQLPQAFDPPDGVLATANARVTLDGYRYPITLNWMAPYRTERIYKVLEASPANTEPGADKQPETGAGTLAPIHKLTPGDMLSLQNDVFSELDQVIAQRLAYSIDHAGGPLKDDKQLHQAADLLRKWNGNVDASSAAAAIVHVERDSFWPMLLIPKLAPQFAPEIVEGADLSKLKNLTSDAAQNANMWQMYTWGERGSVEEQMLMHTPARWLPPGFATWDDFLAAVVKRGLHDAHAPADLSTWQQGKAFPLDIEHPIFSRSKVFQLIIGVPTGTGPQSQSGDGTTVKQAGLAFGPSERFTADLSDPDRTTLNIVLGQSGNPVSPWFMDQFQDWLYGNTYPLPFNPASIQAATTHTLTLNPR